MIIAIILMAYCMQSARNMEGALSLLRKGAATGFAECQFLLGMQLDGAERVIHLRHSAIQGHGGAQLRLAREYFVGSNCIQIG